MCVASGRQLLRTRPVLVNSDEIENPVNLLSGRFDLAFVLTFCWPVLLLPLTYNVVSDDRENGTLAIVASQPVSMRSIAAARLLVRTGAAVTLTVVTSLATLAAMGTFADGVPIVGLLLWAVAVVSTGLFWAGAAALVNAAGWRSATNATVMTATWLAAAIVAPAVIGELVSAFEPIPSRVQLTNEIRMPRSLSSGELAALVTAYYEDHPDATPSNDSADVTAIRGLALQDEVDHRIDPIVTAYCQALARQQRFADWLRFVSPPLLMYDAVTELAGTTTTRYRRFADQVDDYHGSWRAYFYSLVHARVLLTNAHYDRAPRFVFEEESPGTAERRAAVLVGVAVVIGLALLAVAFRATTQMQMLAGR